MKSLYHLTTVMGKFTKYLYRSSRQVPLTTNLCMHVSLVGNKALMMMHSAHNGA